MKSRQKQEPNASVGGAQSARGSKRVGVIAAVAACVCALFAAAGAQASTVTVGSVLPPASTPKPFGEVETLFNTALPEKGANLVSPVNGAIVRWRVLGAKGGPFYLRVLRPNGSGAYTAAGTSGGVTPSGPGLQTFTANIPIHAGDLIGVDPTNPTDEIGIAEVPGASFASIFPTPLDGATVPPRPSRAGQEIELSAEIQPVPAITAIAPSSGSIAGGTAVTITGTDFASASAVKFGSTPATGYTVDSETQITAIAPPSLVTSKVDVAVTTAAGNSAIVKADSFTYTGCVVPKLKGKKLRQAKRALRNADCRPGRVRGQKDKSAKVVKQNPPRGKTLVPGAAVNIKVNG
jgi:hypothetical protein